LRLSAPGRPGAAAAKAARFIFLFDFSTKLC